MAKKDDFQLKTKNGYDFFEVTSALQKDIRRGNEENAMYWAVEMIFYYENYLWRRLKVIVNEDIGIANPNLIVIIETLAKQYFEFKERGDMSCILMLANAILLMCRSEKTRVGDHLAVVIEQTFSQQKERKEIPDYALDMHTRRGKKMGRGLKHFKEIGAIINPHSHIDDGYEERAYKLAETQKDFKVYWGFGKIKPKDKDEPIAKGENGRLFD